jgi:hypothetical protein
MKIKLKKSILDAKNLSDITDVPSYSLPYFNQPAGQEHYKLLVYLSQYFNNCLISDIGTHSGASALALSQNLSNKVFSLDVVNHRNGNSFPSNIEFCIGNFKTEENIQKKILSSSLILLDIDHQYINEQWMYEFLVRNDWKGMLLCDDIHYFQPLHKFWANIKHPKYDLTRYGHSSGTGCVLFGDDIELELS